RVARLQHRHRSRQAGRGPQDREPSAPERSAVWADREGRFAEGVLVRRATQGGLVCRSCPRKRASSSWPSTGSPLPRGRAEGDQTVNIESPVGEGAPVSFALGEDYAELREPVRRICETYPGA